MSNATETIADVQTIDDVKPETSIAKRIPQSTDMQEILQYAEVFVKSGFFADVKSLSQAAVKIMAGREYGFGPFASMRGIYIVNGRTALEANLLAQAIKRSGKYDYRVVELSEQGCTINFFQNRVLIGESTFTAADAKRAGTKNLEKFPRNMLFARALSNGARWHCPDATGGPLYTPEDFGMEQRSDGTYDEPASRPELSEPRAKSDPKPEAVAKEEPEPPAQSAEAIAAALGFDPSKQYRVAEVRPAAKKGAPFSVALVDGPTITCTDQRLFIAAQSAKQSGQTVIVDARIDGETLTLTGIEEMP